MSKIEIIPPSRPTVPARRTGTAVEVATPINPGGIIGSKVTKWQAENQTRALTALSARTRAEADLFAAQTQAVESYINRQQAGARLLELPETIAADRARRRAVREEELRNLYYEHDLARMRRMAEAVRAEAILEDARQALRAQQELGFSEYELEWEQRQCRRLDIQLSAEEAREVLRQHRDERGGRFASANPTDDELTNALYDARRQMRASGLDTARIDALLKGKGK